MLIQVCFFLTLPMQKPKLRALLCMRPVFRERAFCRSESDKA